MILLMSVGKSPIMACGRSHRHPPVEVNECTNPLGRLTRRLDSRCSVGQRELLVVGIRPSDHVRLLFLVHAATPRQAKRFATYNQSATQPQYNTLLFSFIFALSGVRLKWLEVSVSSF